MCVQTPVCLPLSICWLSPCLPDIVGYSQHAVGCAEPYPPTTTQDFLSALLLSIKSNLSFSAN